MTNAITREEKLLAGIADGNGDGIEPITREELFLAKAGGQDVETPEPITRREKLLQGIIDNGGGSTGGGGEWQLINTVTVTEDMGVNSVEISTDSDGKPFELVEAFIIVKSSQWGNGFAYANIGINGFLIGEHRLKVANTIHICDVGGVWTPIMCRTGYNQNTWESWGLYYNPIFIHRVKDEPRIISIKLDFSSCELEVWGKVV